MTRDELKEYLELKLFYSQDVNEVMDAVDAYTSASNGVKPIVSGSLPPDELLLSAIKYGYDYHKTTSFPDKSFEDNMKGNALQWIENRRQ